MRYNTKIQHIVEIDGIEFPTTHDVSEASTSMHAFNEDKTQCVIAYTTRDADCVNPLEDCEGMGKLYLMGRYGNRENEYEVKSQLGLDRNGEPDLDLIPEDSLRAVFKSQLAAKALGRMHLRLVFDLVRDRDDDYEAVAALDGFAGQMWAELEDFAVADRDFAVADPDDWDKAMNILGSAVTMRDIWQECRDAGLIGNRHAVVLDVYDHSGTHFSISGQGPNCRWDTARGVGIWVPDKVAEEEIERRAKVYAKGVVAKARPGVYGAAVSQGDNTFTRSSPYSTWYEAFQWLEAQPHPAPDVKAGYLRAREELAQEALDSYNAWCAGDCWGVVVDAFEIHGGVATELTTDDCFGFVGSEYAESELRSMFDIAVEEFDKETA
jgi:hypothetical protein